MWTLTSQVKLPQPLARFSEIPRRAKLICAAAPAAIGGSFETPHALAQVINFGLDCRGHSFDLHELDDAEIRVGGRPYSASCARLAALAPRSMCYDSTREFAREFVGVCGSAREFVREFVGALRSFELSAFVAISLSQAMLSAVGITSPLNLAKSA